MSRRINLSVLGSYSANEVEQRLAWELGRSLADLPLNVVSGGQQGVMLSLCEAIRTHRRPGADSACVVGILPGSGFGDANPYLDIAIPVGAPHLQNAIVPLAADLVVVIGGAAGTLAELALAWQFRNPIALLGSEGWAGRLGGQRLDTRRAEALPHFHEVEELLRWIARVVDEIETQGATRPGDRSAI
jgi:uncharacterized protein (TIGR00725 family)